MIDAGRERSSDKVVGMILALRGIAAQARGAAPDATLVDTWSVMGMRGTGSDDIVIEDVVVPSERAFTLGDAPPDPGPLYRPRLFLNAGAFAVRCECAGGCTRCDRRAARHGLAGSIVVVACPAAGSRPGPRASGTCPRDRKCRAVYVMEALAGFWTVVLANEIDPIEAMAEIRLAIPYAINESVRAVDLVFRAAGTNANYLANPLERQFRDIHAAAQHYAAFPIHYESAGKVLMGLRPTEVGW